MTFKEFIYFTESRENTALISIDIQPAYISACKHIMPKYISLLNFHKGPIIVFWNGEDLGMDSKLDMQKFLMEWGIDEEVLDRIIWREKVYAFFRNWMDAGLDRKNLIKAIRYMVMNRIDDSRDATEEQWQSGFGDEYDDLSHLLLGEDNINLPDISISELKKLSGCYLCGGGKEECLSEFSFLLEAFNIRYKLIDSLIY